MLGRAKVGISIGHWRRVFCGIWNALEGNQKFTVIMSMVFPVINQTAQILVFYFTIRILSAGISTKVSTEVLWESAAAIAGCFVGAGFVNWIATKIQVNTRIVFKRVVRRFIAGKYLRIREMGLAKEEAEKAFATAQASEHHFHGPMINALNSIVQLAGAILMVFSLVLIVVFFAPEIAGIIVIVGFVLFVLVRFAKSDELHAERQEKDVAIQDMRSRAKRVLEDEGDPEELIQQYLENDLDKVDEREEAARRKVQQTLHGLGIVFTTAILIAAMNLVDIEAFSGFPEAALIAFLLMLKVCLQTVQNMVSHWGHLHRDRNLLVELGLGLEGQGVLFSDFAKA